MDACKNQCILFVFFSYLQQIWTFNFPKVVQQVGKVWWEILNICVANFVSFLAIQNCTNRLRFDKVTESLKVETFLRYNVLLTHDIFAGNIYVNLWP